jgi:LmbE family N-acetylglucosaminyl deacetylase
MSSTALFDRLLVVSPHLDDAVLSAGRVLAAHPGATVATFFSGLPERGLPLTDWDRRCGFASGEQAVLQRREEDRIALSLLEARAVWLDFLDAQYQASPHSDELAEALAPLLRELQPAAVLLPLGLFHSDHLLTHEATWQALGRWPDIHVLAYEDVPYRAQPGQVQQRLTALAQAQVRATPVRWTEEGSAAMKSRALRSYETQLRVLGPNAFDDARAPERCWRLERAA